MVVLSSIGSVLCFIITGVVCMVLRYRRYSKVHTEKHKNKRHTSSNIEVEVFQEGEGMENTSNVFFTNSMNQDFKPNETCSICLDTDTLFITSCGHYFHGKCIFSWL